MQICNFSNGATKLLTKVSGFDFSVAHTYGFKNESGNWWLTVDGNAVVDLTTDDDPVVAQRLDKLSASGKAYVQLASYNYAADFKNIKIVEQIPFNYPSGMTVGGNVTDGYTLTGDKNKVAAFKTALDVKTESIQFKTPFACDWVFLGFTNSDMALSGIFAGEKQKGLCLRRYS